MGTGRNRTLRNRAQGRPEGAESLVCPRGQAGGFVRCSPGSTSQVLSQPGQCHLECRQGSGSLLGYRRASPRVAGGSGQGAIPRRDGRWGGVVGGQTQRPRHTPAHCCLLLPFQSPLSPLLPKALAWVPLEPSVCSFTSNPPEVGGPAARELRALGESRPRNAEPQPPRTPPSGRLPGTAMPPGSLCLFLAAGANTPAETLNPRRAESKGQF